MIYKSHFPVWRVALFLLCGKGVEDIWRIPLKFLFHWVYRQLSPRQKLYGKF